MKRKCVVRLIATAMMFCFTGMATAQGVLPFPEPSSEVLDQ